MKRVLVIFIFAAAGLAAQAQPASGQLFVGGDIGFYGYTQKSKSGSTTTDERSYSAITIMPLAGYFLTDKLAVGAQIGITSGINKNPDGNPEKITNFQFRFEPFGRYYLISGTGGIFAEASVGFGVGKSKYVYEDDTQETNLTSFTAGISPGVYYYIFPKFALEAQFGWFGFSSEMEKDGDEKQIENDFGFNFYSHGISLGFIYTL
jgi:outer membrane protein